MFISLDKFYNSDIENTQTRQTADRKEQGAEFRCGKMNVGAVILTEKIRRNVL